MHRVLKLLYYSISKNCAKGAKNRGSHSSLYALRVCIMHVLGATRFLLFWNLELMFPMIDLTLGM
jgi:hypothetical protein